MKRAIIVIIGLLLASLALAGCTDNLLGAKPSPSPLPTPSTIKPLPTADIPNDLLRDDLDRSIADLEIVG